MANEKEIPEIVPPVIILEDTTTKVEFSPAQQAVFDANLKKAMGRAGHEARAEAEKLRIENTRLKEVAAGQGSADELERVRGELASSRLEQQAILEASVKSQRDLVIAQESSKHGFIDVDTLQRLTRQNLRHNTTTGAFEVIADDGTPVLNATQEPISVTDYFADYASKKPWLVRGQVKSGGGGTSSAGSPVGDSGRFRPEQIFGSKSSSKDAQMLHHKNPAEYARLKALSRSMGLI